MQQILQQFGVDPYLLGAQVVNFLILLFILKKVMYGPFMQTLQKRREAIAKSMQNAEEIEKKLAETEEEKEKALIEASNESKKIIDEAGKSASEIVAQAHQKAQKDMEEILKKGQESLSLEREKLQKQMREEMAEVVSIALEKVVAKAIDPKKQKELIDQTVKTLR